MHIYNRIAARKRRNRPTNAQRQSTRHRRTRIAVIASALASLAYAVWDTVAELCKCMKP